MIFIASDKKSSLIDLNTKTVQKTYATGSVQRRGATYCASSKTVIVHQSKGCISWFSPSMQQPVQRSFTSEDITTSACTRDGVFMLGGTAEGNMYVWNLLTGQLLHIIRAHTRRVTDIAISSDQSMVVTVSEDSVCKTWLFSTVVSREVKSPRPCCVYNGHTLQVNACCFMETGYTVATASSDRTCHLFDGLTGRQYHVFTLEDTLTAVCSAPGDDLLLLGSAGGALFCITLYEKNSNYPKLPVCNSISGVHLGSRMPLKGGHAAAISFILFDTTNPEYAIVGSEDGVLLKWNIASRRVDNEAFPHLVSKLATACFVPKDECLFEWPLATLSKHPLDPCVSEFKITEAAENIKLGIVKGNSCKRRRSLFGYCDNDENGGLLGRRKNRFMELSLQRKKNDGLESLREELKRKLNKLTR